MDLRQIKNIIKEFEESTIDKLEISENDFSIKLEKRSNHTTVTNIPVAVAEPVAQTPPPAAQEAPADDLVLVKAPLVGTFYESPSPDASPFVRVNQKVTKGETLFIVEAMKVMNEVTAPVSGTIVNIHVSDATMVEYGQIIMEIKE